MHGTANNLSAAGRRRVDAVDARTCLLHGNGERRVAAGRRTRVDRTFRADAQVAS